MTAGGLYIPDKVVENRQFAAQDAYVLFTGFDAWKGLGSGKPWAKVGACVKILKYSGEDDTTIEDGALFRVISDSDIFNWWPGEDMPEAEINEYLQQYVDVMGLESIEELKKEWMRN